MALSAVSAAVAAYSAYSTDQNQKAATAASKENATKAAAAADEANNKANQKRANSSALLSSNQLAGKGGQAGTMLTGPGGIDMSSLSLGRSTLLGGAIGGG